MRGFAAFAVFLGHLPHGVFGRIPGAFGVDLFFVISGFIMMHVTQNGTRHFLLKRAIRILPLYWILTIIYAVLLGFGTFITLKSMLFLTSNLVIGFAWTLRLEVIFYMMMFVGAKINQRYRGVIASGLILTGLIIGLILGRAKGYSIIPFFSLVNIEFIIGITMYYIIKRSSFSLRPFFAFIASIILICIMFSLRLILKVSDILDYDFRFLIYGIPSAILFVIFFKGFIKFKFPKFIIMFGNLSFSFYLIHKLVIDKMQPYFNPNNILGWGVMSISIFTITLFLSVISYHIFERKLLNLAKSRFAIW